MVKDKVNGVLLKLSFLDEIHEAQRLKEDLGLDSLSLTNLMVELEEAFTIELSMEDVDPANFLTVTDVYTLMDKYVVKGDVSCADGISKGTDGTGSEPDPIG